MSTNRKYHKSSLYYPDDKDLYDFMHASAAPISKLRSFLQNRGIYLSKKAPAESYYRYISRLPLAWNDLVELVDLVDLAEKREKSTFVDYSFDGDFDLVSAAFEKVSEYRSTKEKEIYHISEKEGKIVVEVEYLEVDTSRTPMLQGRPASLVVELEQVGSVLRATHTSNEAAQKILTAFKGSLGELYLGPNGERTDIQDSAISLKDIIDPEMRVLFFTKLSRSLEGFKYDNTTNVKVARIPKNLVAPLDDSDESDETKLDDEEEQKIKNVIIHGVHIESTKHYKDFLKEGFCISSISWESIEQTSQDKVAFIAGFANSDEATGFEYRVLHRQILDEGKYQAKDKVLPMYLPTFMTRIQNAAIKSLAEVRADVSSRKTEPAKGDDDL